MENSILQINNVSKKFSKNFTDTIAANLNNIFSEEHRKNLIKNEFWSLKNVSLEIGKGEIVGIIGSNGSGKTTLMRIISGIYKQDNGTLKINGKIAAIFAMKSGMHPHLSGFENIYIKASLYGLTKKETTAHLESIIAFSGLAEFIHRPFGVYSAGMKAKLAFAILTAVKPQLFIIDEGLAVGDKTYQEKCFRYLQDEKNNMTTIYITNQHEQLENFATRIIIMHKGGIVGDVATLVEAEAIYEATKNT